MPVPDGVDAALPLCELDGVSVDVGVPDAEGVALAVRVND